MFGDLPKIFDRNFVLNFFFPALIFVVLENSVLPAIGITRAFLPYLKDDLVNDLTVVALFSYLIGVILLVINRELYRFFEGYGRFNPFKLVSIFERTHYRKNIQELERLDDEYRECFSQHKEFPAKSRTKRNEVMRFLSDNYPDKEEFLLPTHFGNIIRSFEIYPRVMYGMEYVDNWSRLQAVMPIDYRSLVDDSKAQVDLWINFQFLSAIVVVQTAWSVSVTSTIFNVLMLLLFFGISLFCMAQANRNALDWGDYAKSSFDIFTPKMREALGFSQPKNREEEKLQWLKFSQAIIYRLPERIPEYRETDSQIVTPSNKTKTQHRKKGAKN